MSPPYASSANGPLHPIAHAAVSALENSDDGARLDEEAARSIRSALILTAGSPDIEWAVRSLLSVAARLSKEGEAPAVDTLIELCCVATKSLAQLGSRRNAAAMRRAIERLEKFTCAPRTNHSAPHRSSATRHQRSGLIFDRLTTRPVRA